ncbi:MAG: sugar phosphate isomerase/epimerase [Candidatus Methanoperedens sp.]|jgi:sugar phosphate isomerase/epimerase|nr:sugar phosphate isomerase/epimerase [Candidatus Methanoperedens sp.]PKL52941.1 MAG: sugar phosphate isomerase/epimerase [Candidatus Methanoperedenaceae archaeon HGW-Methanoperedenaceae-1]
MILGASSFAGSFPELRQEVDSVELYIPKLDVYDGTRLVKSRIKEIKDIFSTYDMATSIHAPYFSDVPTYPQELVIDTTYMNDTAYRLMTESIMIAEALESEVVVVHPGRINSNRKKSFEGMVEGLSRLAEFAKDRNVMLGLENKEGTNTGNFCCYASELIEAIERVGSENLRATFDIGHANLTCGGSQSKLREFVKAVSEYVVHVHVHDNSGVLTPEYWGDFHGAPGSGVVDFSVLEELDFKGVYNLEVFSIKDLLAGKKMLRGIIG